MTAAAPIRPSGAADELDVDVGVVGQGVEIRIVVDERQTHDGDAQRRARTPAALVVDRQRVLFVAAPVVQEGHDAEGRYAGALFEKGQTWVEQGGVAAELVDDEAAHERPLGRREELHVTDQRGEDAAPVDVAAKVIDQAKASQTLEAL